MASQVQKLDFKISTGLKDIIGRELITDDRIAIFELVKNSYDARAHQVTIEFQNVEREGTEQSKILISDDGDGMSYKDITAKWLFVGFSEKKIPRNLSSSDYRDKIAKRKRVFAGAKGIGRFSADRLGSRLRIYTKKIDEDQIHFLDVDWTRFEENQDEEFQTIKVEYSTLDKLPFEHEQSGSFRKGTILEISSLNDSWDRQKLVGLKRYLQRLINPSQQPDNDKFSIELVAKEFAKSDEGREDHERINGPIINEVFARLEKKTTKIDADITTSKIVTTITDKGRHVFTLEEANPFSSLKDVKITVFFLNREAKSAFTTIMGLEPKNYGSIFLYKNGFRIHPYGNENNDWLGLDRRKTQGYARFLGNREVIGQIEVYGLQPGFQEVSSRDGGVVESEAYRQLASPDRGVFLEKVLKRLEQYVVGAINWDSEKEEKQRSPDEVKRGSLEVIEKIVGSVKDPDKKVTFNKNLLSIFKERQVEKIPELIRNVEQITRFVKTAPERKYIESQLKGMRLAARTLEQEAREKEVALQVKTRESLFLQKEASTDKETIINLNHTIENSTLIIRNTIIEINKIIRQGHSVSDIVPLIDDVSLENEKVRVLAGIVSFANFNTKVDVITKDLVTYVIEYVDRILANTSRAIRHRFVNEDVSFVTKFRPLEVSIVIDNFISNAKKAEATLMTFRFELQRDKLRLLIGDNGRGIDAKNAGFLFTRGFTTTTGSGIGLHHVKNIIQSMGGTIRFVGNGAEEMGKGACFEIILDRSLK